MNILHAVNECNFIWFSCIKKDDEIIKEKFIEIGLLFLGSSFSPGLQSDNIFFVNALINHVLDNSWIWNLLILRAANDRRIFVCVEYK